jgi:hypothetical protein
MDLREIKDNKVLTWSMLAVVLAYVILKSAGDGDFTVFLEASRAMRFHQDMYGLWLNKICCRYYYSPLFAVILLPFTYIPYFVAYFLWLGANVWFLIRIWKIITTKIDMSSFTAGQFNVFFLLVFLLSFRFLDLNFDTMQMTIYLLWVMLESIELFDKGKNIKGALLLSLAINIKIMPLVIIPYLLFRKKFIPVLWTALFFIVFLYLPVLFIGFDFNQQLLVSWFHSINPNKAEHNIDTVRGTQSLTSWLVPLLMSTEGELPFKRNIATLDLTTVNCIINGARAFFILLTLYFTGFTFFKKAGSQLRELWELGYIFLVMPLVFPHQQKYEFFLMFPATIYICYFLVINYKYAFRYVSRVRVRTIAILLGLSFILNTLTSDLFIGMYYSDITQHFKTITYGTFLVIAAYALCKPEFIEQIPAEGHSTN